jgi:hypothetical protein
VIARIGRPNNSGGITYRILSYSGTAVPQYRSTPAESTPVLESKITGELNTTLKEENTDDDAARALSLRLTQAERELTGKNSTDAEKWEDLAELLITELRIAAGRTTVSSVPAFLAEHLRRRLWKVDKGSPLLSRQRASGGPVEAQERASGGGAEHKRDASKCPDCFGTGMWYPEGFDKGVARCQHSKLLPD